MPPSADVGEHLISLQTLDGSAVRIQSHVTLGDNTNQHVVL